MDICREALPELEDFHGPDHQFRCHLDEQTRVEAWAAKQAAMGEEMTVA
jgi:hypothetical protein